jgi:hypothetical protein
VSALAASCLRVSNIFGHPTYAASPLDLHEIIEKTTYTFFPVPFVLRGSAIVSWWLAKSCISPPKKHINPNAIKNKLKATEITMTSVAFSFDS